MVKEAQFWSVCIGAWKGVPIYLHISFFLIAILLVGCQLGALPGIADASSLPTGSNLGSAVLTVFAVAMVFAVPTIAQLLVLSRSNQSLHRIFLLPSGASFEWRVGTAPPERLQVHVVGMLASFMFFFCSLLAFAGLESLDLKRFWLHVSPLNPQFVDSASGSASLLACCFWFSAMALFLRAIPIAPFDFGKILREWGQIRLPYLHAKQRAAMLYLTGVICVVLLVGTSYVWVNDSGAPGVWPLVAGLCLLFLARREYLSEVQMVDTAPAHHGDFADMAFPEYDDLSESIAEQATRAAVPEENFDFADLSDVPPLASSWDTNDGSDSDLESWMDENRDSREQAREAQSAAEEALLDELLLKVSAGGIGCLSEQEREVLERVSQIYRSRRKIRS